MINEQIGQLRDAVHVINPFYEIERQKFRPRKFEDDYKLKKYTVHPELMEYYTHLDQQPGMTNFFEKLDKTMI